MTSPTDTALEAVWLTTAEAAAYTGYSAAHLRLEARAGRLHSAQRSPRGERRFRRNDLDAWLTGGGRP